MMLGIEEYGSDSDIDDNGQQEQQPLTSIPVHKPGSSSTSKLPPPKKSSGFSLPPPSGSSASSSGLPLSAPKRKAPKRITIGLPSIIASALEDDDDEPLAKRPRAKPGQGARKSGLLSMLPAPKNKNPVPAAPERVLGGGRGRGLVFHTEPQTQALAQTNPQQVIVEDEDEEENGESTNVPPTSGNILEEVGPEKPSTTAASALPFLPPSLAKGKTNISTEDRPSLPKSLATSTSRAGASKPTLSAPAVDFFSLSSATPSSSSTPTLLASSATPSIPNPSQISSAPAVDDFVPPEPTPTDPYPGYYLLPSGQWAAYDPAYYKSFYNRWKKEYDAHVRALEKGTVKGFEGFEEQAEEVDAQAEMVRARREVKELEERKKLTTGGQEDTAAPKMNIKGAALSGRARGRHQLTTLLTEAYANREALEEKIAQGRRNRKEAGNKYGF